jgi:hypothetical protein
MSTLAFSALFSKFVCSCGTCCVKPNKNRVGIVPHELISMIHRLVFTTHLEDELTYNFRYTELLVFLTLKPQLLSSPLPEDPLCDVGKPSNVSVRFRFFLLSAGRVPPKNRVVR